MDISVFWQAIEIRLKMSVYSCFWRSGNLRSNVSFLLPKSLKCVKSKKKINEDYYTNWRSLIFLFDPFFWVQQLLKNRLLFGRIEAKNNCFWDLMTFTFYAYFNSTLILGMYSYHSSSSTYIKKTCKFHVT